MTIIIVCAWVGFLLFDYYIAGGIAIFWDIFWSIWLASVFLLKLHTLRNTTRQDALRYEKAKQKLHEAENKKKQNDSDNDNDIYNNNTTTNNNSKKREKKEAKKLLKKNFVLYYTMTKLTLIFTSSVLLTFLCFVALAITESISAFSCIDVVFRNFFLLLTFSFSDSIYQRVCCVCLKYQVWTLKDPTGINYANTNKMHYIANAYYKKASKIISKQMSFELQLAKQQEQQEQQEQQHQNHKQKRISVPIPQLQASQVASNSHININNSPFGSPRSRQTDSASFGTARDVPINLTTPDTPVGNGNNRNNRNHQNGAEQVHSTPNSPIGSRRGQPECSTTLDSDTDQRQIRQLTPDTFQQGQNVDFIQFVNMHKMNTVSSLGTANMHSKDGSSLGIPGVSVHVDLYGSESDHDGGNSDGNSNYKGSTSGGIKFVHLANASLQQETNSRDHEIENMTQMNNPIESIEIISDDANRNGNDNNNSDGKKRNATNLNARGMRIVSNASEMEDSFGELESDDSFLQLALETLTENEKESDSGNILK